MPTVTFRPTGARAEVASGTELLAAARAAGVDIDAPCGGKGTCGKCMVRIVAGEVDSGDLGMLPPAAVVDGHVLACKARLLDGDVVVEVPERLGHDGGKFADIAEDVHLIRKDLLPERWNYDPLALKWYLHVPPPQLEDGLADLDRLVRAIQHDWGPLPVMFSLPVIRRVTGALRERDGAVTVTLIRAEGELHAVGIEPGDTTVRHFGIAVDVGTTTVAVQLVYLPLAEAVATASDYNGQIACGLDVISRINYARRPGGLQELRDRGLKTINRLIAQVSERQGIAPAEIGNAVVSGNTTMVHLLLGLDPEYIRLAPYTPTLLDVPYLTAEGVGLDINPESWVCFSPAVGSYVGGDITAGLLCTDLATDAEELSLFIDIGTNGEIALGNREFLVTCACSAGPAFEGGGIGCGMRAALGAIERVQVDAGTGMPHCSTIGDVRPRGICGSGMIALLADLFTTGWLDAAGKLDRSRPCPAITIDGRQARYTLATAEAGASGTPLSISEADIENIIRAKAAIYSACALLLEQLGFGFADLATVYIAGGFGRFLDLEKATVLGLIPDLPRDRFRYIGNASLMGSYMVLVSQDYRRKQHDIARRMTYVELSTDPAYMDQYTGALFIPHTDPERFPSVRCPTRPRTP